MGKREKRKVMKRKGKKRENRMRCLGREGVWKKEEQRVGV